jgi:hypothetical protein
MEKKLMRGLSFQEYPTIASGISFSNEIIAGLRSDLKGCLDKYSLSSSISIVVTGSFGRKEASINSDIDYFIICKDQVSLDKIRKPEIAAGVLEIIKKYVEKDPGSTGTFGADPSHLAELSENIGGPIESNKQLTRRLLLILEGDWIYGESTFNEARDILAEKYLQSFSLKKVPKFFLNDVIRYHRTVAVDFQQKVDGGKGWGLRNVKLRLSRKMLYFGGLIAATELINIDQSQRKSKLLEIIQKPAVERIQHYGSCEEINHKILDVYNKFLQKIESPEIRAELDNLQRDKREDSLVFKELRTLGEDMTRECMNWIKVRHKDNEDLIGHLVF